MGTIDYYDTHADEFVAGTLGADMGAHYKKFKALLPAHAAVMDCGCGSGRDTLHFLACGYEVTPLDGSSELARRATELTGLPARIQTFDQIDDASAFDGIWACSSLLHVKKDDLPAIFARLARALRPSGVLYVSFKYGTFEGERNGRYFTDLTEEGLARIVAQVPNLRIRETWVTSDVRPGRDAEKWLNALIVK